MKTSEDSALRTLIDLAPLAGLAVGTGWGVYQETLGRKRPDTWSRVKKGLLFLDDPVRHFLRDRPPKVTGLDQAKNVALARMPGWGSGTSLAHWKSGQTLYLHQTLRRLQDILCLLR